MKRQLPKNVRQIGNVSDSSKIYVEDYVDTFFNQLSEKVDQKPMGAFLVGETVQEKDEDYIYVYGAIQMSEVVQKGKDIFIPDNTWKKGCEACKEYFGDAEILGWFLTSTGQALETNHNIVKVHQKLFSREKSIFVAKDAREKEEKFFIHKYKDLMECGGHYVYYERNVEMQNYMIANRKKTGMTPSEIIEDTVTKNFRSIIRDKKEKDEEKTRSRGAYALSTFLVLIVLVIGITLINNYDKMSGLRGTLDKLENQGKEDVVETIGTIVNVDDVQEEETKEEPDNVDMLEKVDEPEDVKKSESGEEPADIGQPGQEGDDGGDGVLEDDFVDEVQGTSQQEYIVEKGDTLASISKKIYGDITHVDAICNANGLEDGNLIFIGQKLLLP
jgi:LysM repeat protein